MRYIRAEELLALHDLIIAETGGAYGVREQGLLHAIVEKPAASFGGEDLYKGLFLKAAVLMEAIVNYHVFVDGNKRTGFVAGARFLLLNGYEFDGSNSTVEEVMVAIAKKEMNVAEIADWLEENSTQT